MSERSSKLLIEDMIECTSRIFRFTEGQSYGEFVQDDKTQSAVLRMLEVLGEAANRIPKEERNRFPEIEWGKIIRSRNLIIHDYEIIDYSVIWKIITTHLPPLKKSLEEILKELYPDQD